MLMVMALESCILWVHGMAEGPLPLVLMQRVIMRLLLMIGDAKDKTKSTGVPLTQCKDGVCRQ
jgi:hypothetical protein